MTPAVPGSVLVPSLGTYLPSSWSLILIFLNTPQSPCFSVWLYLTLSALEELVPTRNLEDPGWLGKVVAHSRER